MTGTNIFVLNICYPTVDSLFFTVENPGIITHYNLMKCPKPGLFKENYLKQTFSKFLLTQESHCPLPLFFLFWCLLSFSPLFMPVKFYHVYCSSLSVRKQHYKFKVLLLLLLLLQDQNHFNYKKEGDNKFVWYTVCGEDSIQFKLGGTNHKPPVQQEVCEKCLSSVPYSLFHCHKNYVFVVAQERMWITFLKLCLHGQSCVHTGGKDQIYQKNNNWNWALLSISCSILEISGVHLTDP